MELSEFRKEFQKLCFAFNKPFEDGQAIVWFEDLCGYKDDDIKNAMKVARKNCRYQFPTIAEVINEIPGPDVGSSWQRVLECARRGGMGWEKLTDLEIASLGEIGGLQMIQDSSDEGLTFLFNKFKTGFDILNKRKVELRPEARFATLGIHPESVISNTGRRREIGGTNPVAIRDIKILPEKTSKEV